MSSRRKTGRIKQAVTSAHSEPRPVMTLTRPWWQASSEVIFPQKKNAGILRDSSQLGAALSTLDSFIQRIAQSIPGGPKYELTDRLHPVQFIR